MEAVGALETSTRKAVANVMRNAGRSHRQTLADDEGPTPVPVRLVGDVILARLRPTDVDTVDQFHHVKGSGRDLAPSLILAPVPPRQTLKVTGESESTKTVGTSTNIGVALRVRREERRKRLRRKRRFVAVASRILLLNANAIT